MCRRICALHTALLQTSQSCMFYVAFFRGPGECPADSTSASCLLLLRLAFLPRRPSPAELAPEAGSHGRHQTEAATFSVDVTFPRVCRVCREYSCSNCSDKVSNAKKITNKHLTAAHGGGVFFFLPRRQTRH